MNEVQNDWERDITKTLVLFKLIYEFNTILIKIPKDFFLLRIITSFQTLPGEESNYDSLQLFIVIFEIFFDWYSPLEWSDIKY